MQVPIVNVFDSARQLAHAAADTIVFSATQAVHHRGRFHWAVAGGGTPKATYAVLATAPHRDVFPWDRFDAWLGDERIVAPDDPASNRRMVLDHLFAPAGADTDALQPFDTTIAPAQAARDYAKRIAERLPHEPGSIPVLDLVVLGLGADAHTASWFPGSTFPEECWVAASEDEHAGYRRLTLTPTLVNAARRVLFLVAGGTKREAIEKVFGGPRDPLEVPAQRVAPADGHLMWMIDREAAGQFFDD